MSLREELIVVTDDDSASEREYYVKYKPLPLSSSAANDSPAAIKRSSRSPLPRSGRTCCPASCYKRNCVLLSAVLTVVVTVTTVSLVVGFAVSALHPHMHVAYFVSGTCTVESGNYTGYPSQCGCNQGGKSCPKLYYPCLEVIVRYTIDTGETHHTVLYASDDELTYTSHCSITPHCTSGSDNKQEVEAFRLKYGQTGTSFPCFHHPTGYGAVITRLRKPLNVVHLLLWPSLVAALSLVSCIFVFFHCVPKYCNKEF